MGCVNSTPDVVDPPSKAVMVPFDMGAVLRNQQDAKTQPEQPLQLPGKHPLDDATYQNTKPYTPTFEEAKVVKIYDGDTLHVAALINGKPYRFTIRMYGYDSPELKTKDPEEKKAAIKARDVLAARIDGRIVKVNIHPIKEKYGRVLADLSDENGQINSWMIEQGHGKPYFGGTKELFSPKDGPTEIVFIEND